MTAVIAGATWAFTDKWAILITVGADSGRIAESTTNCTGTYWEGGLSVGCYILLDAHWGFEAGLRGGYRTSDVNAYDVEMPYYYFNRNFRENHFGVTGVDISISYRFGSRK